MPKFFILTKWLPDSSHELKMYIMCGNLSWNKQIELNWSICITLLSRYSNVTGPTFRADFRRMKNTKRDVLASTRRKRRRRWTNSSTWCPLSGKLLSTRPVLDSLLSIRNNVYWILRCCVFWTDKMWFARCSLVKKSFGIFISFSIKNHPSLDSSIGRASAWGLETMAEWTYKLMIYQKIYIPIRLLNIEFTQLNTPHRGGTKCK